ncbi:MAG: adenylyl-sulfate kinase [Saprospiraceae bacterium]|nr:adenylyl-sulfate kinase [Saprospiraceae bacterium]
MNNLHPIHDRLVPRSTREEILGQKGMVLWMTGLSGSGKSSIAEIVEKELSQNNRLVYILDGDNIRTGINRDLGFSLDDRKENIRRIAEVAKLLVDAGLICICCFVSPTDEIRQQAKQIIGKEDFHMVYVKASLEACEERDVKGLYKKARKGEIKGFTGIDSPFEVPSQPDLIIDTESESPAGSARVVVNWIEQRQS